MIFNRLSKLKRNSLQLNLDINKYRFYSDKSDENSNKLIEKSSKNNSSIKKNVKNDIFENSIDDDIGRLNLRRLLTNFKEINPKKRIPVDTDVLIIGGGIIGASCAYFIKKLAKDLTVTVIERDSDYTSSSTFWSVGGFRQQFSLVENIQMSLFGANFLRRSQELLYVKNTPDQEKLDLDIHYDGYLFLASNAEQVDKMINNHKIQLYEGAKVSLFNGQQLQKRFPWLNIDDIELGSYGYQNEGWLDARKYLVALRCKAESLGAEFIKGNLIDFEAQSFEENPYGGFRKITKAVVDDLQGTTSKAKFHYCVNAAGPWANQVAALAGIGDKTQDPHDRIEHNLSAGLPVVPRKRYVYLIHSPDGPVLNVPLTIDTSGVWFRRHGLSNTYVCGLNQGDEASEPSDMDLNKIDYDYFNERIRPVLEKRVVPFKNSLKVLTAWSGYYDYNTFDQNLIIGPHNAHKNILFANGSSGHGLQHAAAIGNAISEMIVYNNYKKIDLTRFSFERILFNTPVKEIDVV